MKIVVFDIDGVLTNEVGFVYKYAPNFLRQKYNLEIKDIDLGKYSLSEIYNLKTLLREKGYEEDSAKKQAKQISQHFWNYYFLKYCSIPLDNEAKEVVKVFREKGYFVYIVSTRGKKTKEQEKIIDFIIRKVLVRMITVLQFWKSGLKIDALILPSSTEEKIKYIKSLNPDYVFEDQPEIINSLMKDKNVHSKLICRNNNYNIGESFSDKVIRINGFVDKTLKPEMDHLINVKMDNKPKVAKSDLYMFYRFIRFVGKPIVFLKYKPIVCGKDRILDNKNIAFIGNHRHKSDPIVLVAIIKQVIHWAALQRMFEGKEDLFSNTVKPWKCNLSAKFLKRMGCVPIARPENKDCLNINVKSFMFLAKQLRGKRASIGFFPEGTLNRNFKEQNLLDLKSKQIFKLVATTKCFIQPFSIVWIPKNTVIQNRVIIIFSYPINSEGRTDNEIMSIWKEEVEENIVKANQFIEYLISVDKSDLSTVSKNMKVKNKLKSLKII